MKWFDIILTGQGRVDFKVDRDMRRRFDKFGRLIRLKMRIVYIF